MSDFKARAIAVLGRQPALGLAELESLFKPEHVRPIEGAALLDIDAGEINFKRLGGTVKIARILTTLDTSSWPAIEKYLIEKVPEHLKDVPEGKFTLGLSVYGIVANPQQINRTALIVKKAAKRSMRVVPNKEPALNSAQVLHNKLTTKGAWELLFIRDGRRTILAQTFFVQDIEDYGARDQVRPYRDAKVGMLPPKLAQVIVNLAMREPDLKKLKGKWDAGDARKQYVVLDPFAGTGVVLQEALLMGYSVYGTDLDPRMVDYSKKNLRWLIEKRPEIEGRVVVEQADATTYQWPGFSSIASETYLGRPLAKLPAPENLQKIAQDVNTIIRKFLENVVRQARPERRLALAVPAWRIGKNEYKHLPLLDDLTDMGYNLTKFKHVRPEELIYFRENQLVARQIVVLETKDKQ